MRWAIRVVLFPVTMILSVLIAFLEFISSIGIMFLGLLCSFTLIAAIACFIRQEFNMGIEALILSFIFSPFGLPRIVLWLLAILEFLNYKLKNL